MERHIWIDGNKMNQVVCVKCGKKVIANKDTRLLPIYGCSGKTKKKIIL